MMLLKFFSGFALFIGLCSSQSSSFGSDINEKEKTLWEKKKDLHLAKSFAKGWLFDSPGSIASEYPTYDGWYNNPWNPSLGSRESSLIRLLPAAYEGGIYRPINRSQANPFVVSEVVMQDIKTCNGFDTSSSTGKNVFMVFFGQFAVEDIIDARVPSCPPNYFNIPIPKKHEFEKVGIKDMPFIRTNYDKKSGKSSNAPRKQLNSATAWIDGSVIYGKSRAHTEVLRAFKHGLLKSDSTDNFFPASNDGYLSLFSPSKNIEDSKIERPNFRLGNRLAHENPFVLTLNIIFYRWHNYLAKTLCEPHKNWDDEQCFNEARKWVVATLQNIIVYQWVPALLDEDLPNYSRYDPSIDPSISNAFQSAAMRFGHTLVPPAVYVSKKTGEEDLNTTFIELCKSFYDAQGFLYNHSVEAVILGMVMQAAEREDASVADDLRRHLHGPPEFTQRDLMAINIQRGRDHGLPGYGVARKFLLPYDDPENYTFQKLAFGKVKEKDLKELYSSVDDIDLFVGGLLESNGAMGPVFKEIIREQFIRIRDGDRFWFENIENVKEKDLKELYSSVDDIDLFVGGLLESNGAMGPVFKEIIREQFIRIRDGDRFWFENIENGLFTEEEIKQIKSTTIQDVILSVASHVIRPDDLQQDLFHLPHSPDFKWSRYLYSYPCRINGTDERCYTLQPIKNLTKCSKTYKDTCAEPETYDYFTGSGVIHALSFLFLFLFIVGCIIALFLMVHLRKKEIQRMRHSVKQQRKVFADENTVLVSEWVGPKEGLQDVLIHFMPERKQLSVSLLNKQILRTIDLKHVRNVELQVSAGGHLHYVLVRIVREYNLVIKFESIDEKESFIEKLEQFLGKVGIGRQRLEINPNQILKLAFTKADRQAQLEKFFRVVFSQAFSIHKDLEVIDLDYNQAKEIVNVELTAYEFAEALSLRPDALFVKQMFALIDADGNGYISFREFLNVIVIFAKGGPEEKTKLMFDMYDIDHSGKLSRQEFSDMIRSLLELANQSLSASQMDNLIASMFTSAGLEKKEEITFDDFSHLLADHREELGYVHLSFDIGSGFKAAPSAPTAFSRKSIVARAEETVRAYSIVGEESLSKIQHPSHLRVETKPVVFEKDPTKQRVNQVIRFIENYKLHIFWIVLYTLILFGIFIQKAYSYSVEAEHTGFRRVAGYGVTVSRGAASALMFAYATILLTMCRNTITFLRETFFHKFVPFDAAISFHKYIAVWALFFTLFHVIGHGINFYHVGTQTVQDLQCLFPNFHLDPHHPPKLSYWIFQTITGITGVFLVIVLALMYVFAVQFARRHVFNAFWKTHNLYPVMYILMILHGIGHLLQPPMFYYFFLGPCVLFTLDVLVSVSRKKIEISVIKAELLPSGVTHLEFKRPENFEYKSGQWVRIACVPLNKNEYHPFTLSSAPHEENLSLHIRAVGPWTTNLRKVYDPNNLQQYAYPKIYLDGPYGEGHQDWFRYDVSVLVGGGIGITPFASILKDIVFKSSLRHKIFCKKLYFIWVTRSQKQFEWMIDIIREVEENDTKKLVDVHIFITQFYQKFDLRTTMLYICEQHFQRVCGKSLFTGLHSKTHFGRPDFQVFFSSLRQEHAGVSKIAVFSCGPPQMTRSVQLSCEELNKCEGAIFVHHYENF